MTIDRFVADPLWRNVYHESAAKWYNTKVIGGYLVKDDDYTPRHFNIVVDLIAHIFRNGEALGEPMNQMIKDRVSKINWNKVVNALDEQFKNGKFKKRE